MATLIPSLSSCLPRMTTGERRLARRLEEKLEDDYLLWYDVPVGSTGLHPDFIVMHPRRGVLILEVKDWRLDTLQQIDKTRATLLTASGVKEVANPLEQARAYAQSVCTLLEKDPQLINSHARRHEGKLIFPWSYGVVFTHITRRQFDATDMGEVIPPQRVICQDEMYEDIDEETFQQRLWQMFPWQFGDPLTLPQIDRIRWHLFPEIRITTPAQGELFNDASNEDNIPDILRLMDLQQEQLARSLGEGHRVIHGVAGSGKTMILGYRCLHLARILNKPILVMCYNVALAARLAAIVDEKGISENVTVRTFHAWRNDQLKHYHVTQPKGLHGEAFFSQLVQTVIEAVDRGQIPSGQYGAILIDEGHDFAPPWLKLVAQMVNPETNALLLLYDDAQSIYKGAKKQRRFSFKRLGIQAQGRTTILRLNYRNTAEVLNTAYNFAREVLAPEESDEDGVPLVQPESAERHGPPPEVIRMPSFSKEADYIVGRFQQLNAEGIRWRDMAVVYRNNFMGEAITERLQRNAIPVEWLHAKAKNRRFRIAQNSVKVVTFHSSKGLEFPVVAIPGIGYLPHSQEVFKDEVRLMYVAMTRAMDRLIITSHRDSVFGEMLVNAG